MVSVQRSLQALQSYELGINPLRAILSIGYVLLVVVNGLAGGGHFSNGKTNSSLSAKYSTPLTPPG